MMPERIRAGPRRGRSRAGGSAGGMLQAPIVAPQTGTAVPRPGRVRTAGLRGAALRRSRPTAPMPTIRRSSALPERPCTSRCCPYLVIAGGGMGLFARCRDRRHLRAVAWQQAVFGFLPLATRCGPPTGGPAVDSRALARHWKPFAGARMGSCVAGGVSPGAHKTPSGLGALLFLQGPLGFTSGRRSRTAGVVGGFFGPASFAGYTAETPDLYLEDAVPSSNDEAWFDEPAPGTLGIYIRGRRDRVRRVSTRRAGRRQGSRGGRRGAGVEYGAMTPTPHPKASRQPLPPPPIRKSGGISPAGPAPAAPDASPEPTEGRGRWSARPNGASRLSDAQRAGSQGRRRLSTSA